MICIVLQCELVTGLFAILYIYIERTNNLYKVSAIRFYVKTWPCYIGLLKSGSTLFLRYLLNVLDIPIYLIFKKYIKKHYFFLQKFK